MVEPGIGLSEGRRTIDIDVGFDAETGVYYVLASDLQGLHVEMPTFESFVEVATDLAPNLMDNPGRGARLQFRRMVDLTPTDGG